MARSKHFYIRKAHRYLGILLGIQFLFWTISGMYFSWSDIDEIHGDYEKRRAPLVSAHLQLVSPTTVLNQLNSMGIDFILSLQLVNVEGMPLYQVRYIAGTSHHDETEVKSQLADALTGKLRGPLSKEEAVALAVSRFIGKETVKEVRYFERTNGHHEYRESPLPAYGVTFDNAATTTVYVASELGTVQSFRNSKWRIFDFLWMTHTMDYTSRDNFGNILLRLFSILGLITVLSGFALYFVSTRRFRKSRIRSRNDHININKFQS
jgi:hypothetical protein